MVKSVVYLCFTGHPFFNLFDLTYVVKHAENDSEIRLCRSNKVIQVLHNKLRDIFDFNCLGDHSEQECIAKYYKFKLGITKSDRKILTSP